MTELILTTSFKDHNDFNTIVSIEYYDQTGYILSVRNEEGSFNFLKSELENLLDIFNKFEKANELVGGENDLAR